MQLLNRVPETTGATEGFQEFLVVHEKLPGEFTDDGLLILERALTNLVPFVVRREDGTTYELQGDCLKRIGQIEQQQRSRTSAIAKVATGLYDGDWIDSVEDKFASYPHSTPTHWDGLVQQYWQARIATPYGEQAAPSSVVIDRYTIDAESYAVLSELYSYYRLSAEKGAGYRTMMSFLLGCNKQTDLLIKSVGEPRATYGLASDNATDPIFFPNGYNMHLEYRTPGSPQDLFVHTFNGTEPGLRRTGVSSVVHRLGRFL